MQWSRSLTSLQVFHLLALTLLLAWPGWAAVGLPQQVDSMWHISPGQINILVHDTQPLQILDSSAHPLQGASWQVDNPALATITADSADGAMLKALAPGTVIVTATLNGLERQTEVKIWPDAQLPTGTIKFSVQPLGRNIDVLPAYPIGSSPSVDIFSLEQDSQNTYVRGISQGGIQQSLWVLHGYTGKLEIVCGDKLGGLIFSAVSADSYTVYSVAPEGKLRWKRTLTGIRKGHTLNFEGMLYLLNQSREGFSATITAWDEETGDLRFTLQIPGSIGHEVNLQNGAPNILCVPGRSTTGPMGVITSDLFTNTDGDTYAAFTHNEWTVGADQCIAGPLTDLRAVYFTAQNDLILWRIHPDGTYESSVIDSVRLDHLKVGDPFRTLSPTGAIIPDGLAGVLLSVRSVPALVLKTIALPQSDFLYRITPDAGLAYKMTLPVFDGPRHDAMVLGENDTGFLTRGKTLLKFDVRTGAEIWRREVPGLMEVYAALADGGVMVRVANGTPLAVAPPPKKQDASR